MKKYHVILIILLTIGMVFTACGESTPTLTATPTITPTATPTATPAPVMPKMLNWGTLDIGSSTYAYTAVPAGAIRDKFGIPVRMVPVGNDMGRLTLARTGMVDMATMIGSAYLAREGLTDFASRAWGPQRLRMLYHLISGDAVNSIAVRGDSGINTVSDLKGKKIPYVVGLAGHNIEVEASLAFAGLTWDDVIKVELPSYGSSAEALLEGKTDLFYGGSNSAFNIKIAAAPGGIHFLPLPRSDKEGWLRYNAVSPNALPAVGIAGPGITESNPYEGSIATTVMDAYDFLDDDIAYFTTKAWVECYDLYKSYGEKLMSGDLAHVLDVPGLVRNAWHPGSIRYFKEIGKWTPEMEEWNNKILERENKLLKAWEDCIAEMDAKELKENELPALWDSYRKNIPMVQ